MLASLVLVDLGNPQVVFFVHMFVSVSLRGLLCDGQPWTETGWMFWVVLEFIEDLLETIWER